MILKFEGDLTTWAGRGASLSGILIGGRDPIKEIEDALKDGRLTSPATVAFMGSEFAGELAADHGSPAYSEYTPGDPAELIIGGHEIVSEIQRFEGQYVSLWVADEPVDVLSE